jgi:hypothetical protein
MIKYQSTEYDSIPVCKGGRTAGYLSPLCEGVASACNFSENVSIRYNDFDKKRREINVFNVLLTVYHRDVIS